MTSGADARTQAALRTMQRNREQLLQAYAPTLRPQFPRSATFRWIASHFSGQKLVSTLLSAAVANTLPAP